MLWAIHAWKEIPITRFLKKSIVHRIFYIVSNFWLWQSSCGGPPNYCAWRSGTQGPRKGMFTALGLFYRRSQTGLPLLTVTTWWHLVRNIILRPKEKTPDKDIITRNKWRILFTMYWLWVDYNWFDIILSISELKVWYHDLYHLIVDVVHKVKSGERPPFRPEINDNYSESLNLLMTECWSENPDNRPTFDVIVKRFKTIFRYPGICKV